MYCSDCEDGLNSYASEHPYEGGHSSTEYDSGYESYDEKDLNQLYASVERSISETCQISWVTQLLSQQTAEETGCATSTEYTSMLQKEEDDATEERREQKEAADAIEKMERLTNEKIEADKWSAIKALLPTESRLGRLKRYKEGRAQNAKMKRNGWLDRKARRAKPKKNLPFGHRRNGGGKSRARANPQAGSDAAKQQEAVTKLRRVTRRKLVQSQKKVDEDTRRAEFKNGSRIVESTIVVKVEHIEVEEPENEEEIIELQIEKDIEEEEQDRVRQLLCEKAVKETEEELVQKKIDEQKATTNFQHMETVMAHKIEEVRKKKQDEIDNGSWIEVEKKSSSKKTVVKVTDPRVLYINFTTPQMAHEQKIEQGLKNLTNSANMQNKLKCTKMCRSIILKRTCPHGSRCRFAHSLDELQVADCFFKDACNRVRKSGSEYKNCSHTKCTFIHPGESMECYCCRLGLPIAITKPVVKRPQVTRPVVKRPQVVRPQPFTRPQVVNRPVITKSAESCWNHVDVKPIEVMPLPIVVDDNWTAVKKKPKTTRRRVTSGRKQPPTRKSSGRKKKDAFCESVGTGKPCRHGQKCRFQHVDESVSEQGQVILRVPKALAIKAMQNAMKRGLKNVKVVVV